MKRQLAGLAVCAAALSALLPITSDASGWGSPYGDPYGFCAQQSRLPGSYGVIVTNDPSVPTNPERDTFWGWHPNPGYDDWYGHWYGDFRGRPGDDSGWVRLMTVYYGQVGHWNFSDFGWAVHGHAKQYIAYDNWTFAGSCGFGYGDPFNPPPYMADVVGTPVADIYVDSVPPFTPQPYVNAISTTSATFAWPAVADRGDGEGPDYYVSGLDHYTSWLTVDGGPPIQRSETSVAAPIQGSGLRPGQSVCAHVTASDRLGNTSPEGTACVSTPLQPAPTLVVGVPAAPPPVLRIGPVPQPQPVPTLIVGVPQPQPVPTLIVGPVPSGPPVPVPVVPAPPVVTAPPPPVVAAPPPPPSNLDLPVYTIAANPSPGLVGLPSWFWLSPAPAPTRIDHKEGGYEYRVEITPADPEWSFGDGGWLNLPAPAGYGLAYPARSPVAHTYQTHDRLGYGVRVTISVRVTWSVLAGGSWQGPFDLGSQVIWAALRYPVQQAQPEVAPY